MAEFKMSDFVVKKKTVRKARAKPAEGRKLSVRERKEVRQLIHVEEELKYFSTGLASAGSYTTPVVSGITSIPQGLTDSNRVGDSLNLCGTLEFRAVLTSDTGNDPAQQLSLIRIALFQWHPTTAAGGGTQPAASDFFLNGATGAVDMTSSYNHDQRQNYKVLWDEVFKLTGNGGVPGNAYNDNIHCQITRRIPLTKCRKRMQFVAAGTTTASNHLYVVTFSDRTGPDIQNPTIYWQVKVFFRDD